MLEVDSAILESLEVHSLHGDPRFVHADLWLDTSKQHMLDLGFASEQMLESVDMESFILRPFWWSDCFPDQLKLILSKISTGEMGRFRHLLHVQYLMHLDGFQWTLGEFSSKPLGALASLVCLFPKQHLFLSFSSFNHLFLYRLVAD